MHKNSDPLYHVFEYLLFSRSYDDPIELAKAIAAQYIQYLDSSQAYIVENLRQELLDELFVEAHEMLIKKMYGCVEQKFEKHYGKVMQIYQGCELVALEYHSVFNEDTPSPT